MKRHLKVYLFAGLMAALMTVSVLAQARPGSINGVVRNAAGAVVPQAQIIFRNQSTGSVKIVQTDENGAYSVSEIAPGEYEASVSASGFQPLAQHATVESAGRITLDFKLESEAEDEEASMNDGDPNEPGSSSRSFNWQSKADLSLFGTGKRFLPVRLGYTFNGHYTSRDDPGGILMTTRNDYGEEDKSGATDRLGKAIRAAKPDGQR